MKDLNYEPSELELAKADFDNALALRSEILKITRKKKKYKNLKKDLKLRLEADTYCELSYCPTRLDARELNHLTEDEQLEIYKYAKDAIATHKILEILLYLT
jgi:hypothetical protein